MNVLEGVEFSKYPKEVAFHLRRAVSMSTTATDLDRRIEKGRGGEMEVQKAIDLGNKAFDEYLLASELNLGQNG